MRICFLVDEYPPGRFGGIGVFTQTLARSLVRRGHDVCALGLYSPASSGTTSDEGVTVIRLERPRFPGLRILCGARRIGRALRRLDQGAAIDVLEGPNLSLARVPYDFPAARVLRLHTVLRPSGIVRPIRTGLIRRSVSAADGICAVSEFAARSNLATLKQSADAIRVLPNSVDISRFCPQGADREVEGRILFVGAMRDTKGVRRLLASMPSLLTAIPEAHLVLIGADTRDAGSGRSYLETLRAELSPALSRRVIFTGHVPHEELPDAFARAQVCVFPSDYETAGIASLEAMAMGKAVVASRTGAGPEIIEHGVSGLLCDPFDPRSIADQLISALRNASFRQTLGSNARARIAEHFSADTVAARNEAFYLETIGGKRSSAHAT